jgi:pimeloyl-ACP methyl ester carboxylesterase
MGQIGLICATVPSTCLGVNEHTPPLRPPRVEFPRSVHPRRHQIRTKDWRPHFQIEDPVRRRTTLLWATRNQVRWFVTDRDPPWSLISALRISPRCPTKRLLVSKSVTTSSKGPLSSLEMAELGPAAYDEFGLLHENAFELGLDITEFPIRRREFVPLSDDRLISAIVWGTTTPDVVMIHGGGQNAHTWDSTLLALGRPALAIDLPGHGHSDGPADSWPSGHADPEGIANDLKVVIETLAPSAHCIVGLSLGGLAAIALLHTAPELVRSLVLLDITPGVVREDALPIINFLEGPREFSSFDELLQRTIEHNPTRSESSLSRGILHNAIQNDDGTWTWRYRRHVSKNMIGEGSQPPDSEHMWTYLANAQCPVVLLRGTRSQSALSEAHEARFRSVMPSGRVDLVDAGHSIQGDAPMVVAHILEQLLQ